MEFPHRTSKIRTKTNVDVELVLLDGTTLSGAVFIGLDERVQDLMNDAKSFFPLRLEDNEVLLVNKAAVAVCKTLSAGK